MSMTPVLGRATAWIVGGDTGASSKFIWAHMMGHAQADKWKSSPGDTDDLGRCLRLLKLIPEWRERIPEMAKYSPEWKALAARWAELEAAPNDYNLMRSILDPVDRSIRIGDGVRMRFSKRR